MANNEKPAFFTEIKEYSHQQDSNFYSTQLSTAARLGGNQAGVRRSGQGEESEEGEEGATEGVKVG